MGLGTTLTSAKGHNANYVRCKLASPGVQAPCRGSPLLLDVCSAVGREKGLLFPPATCWLSPPPPPHPRGRKAARRWDRLLPGVLFGFVSGLSFFAVPPGPGHPAPRPPCRAESVLYPVHSKRLVCAFDVRTQFWGSGGNMSHLRGSRGGRAERVNKGTRGAAGVGGRAWVAMQGPPAPRRYGNGGCCSPASVGMRDAAGLGRRHHRSLRSSEHPGR